MRRRASHAVTPELLDSVAARFKVLSEPARLRVLHELRTRPLHVSALMGATGLNQANLSKHLQLLHAHGFVSRRRDGQFTFYAIADEGVFTLCDLVCGHLERDGEQRMARLRPSNFHVR